jgi:serine/threonine protein phosphatase PrpC
MMNDISVACPRCHERGRVDDAYCEVCGAMLASIDGAGDRVEEFGAGIAGVSDRGVMRARNEDMVGVGRVDGAAFAIVCDGVATAFGGHDAAVVAVTSARIALRNALERRLASGYDAVATMNAALVSAQEAVVNLARHSDAHRAAACTFVAAVWDGIDVTVANVGDSRAYWLGDTTSRRLSIDDSWAEEQVEAGVMSEAEAMEHPDGHVITRWLGPDAPDAPFRTVTMRPHERGRVVLCSDGMWQYAPAASELSELTLGSRDAGAPEVAQRLVNAACTRGGADNVTVAVIEVAPNPAEMEER